MAGKRKHLRIIKRLNAEFSFGGESFRATTSNLSEGGLFLRTQKPLPADLQVDIRIQLPDDTVSSIKGTVRQSIKSVAKNGRSGMGVEISECDRHYVNFLNSFLPPLKQIIYDEHKKSLPQPAAEKIGHPSPQESGPISLLKSPSVVAREADHEIKENEIDSLISSLFSKNQKKE